MRGRPPLPTAVKKLHGEKRPSRINNREPDPSPGNAECPRFLKGDARAEWNRIAPELIKMGIFKAVDLSAITGYCQIFASVRKFERLCEKVGIERAIEKGYRKALLADRAQLLKFAVEFGFTPSSRSRIKMPEPPPPGDKDGEENGKESFAEFLKKSADEQEADA